MKIYTGGGDNGKTSLFSGERVTKSHIRIEAYGDVDELNSVLGTVASSLTKEHLTKEQKQLIQEIQNIQIELFHIGAWLSTTTNSPSVSYLEKMEFNSVKTLEAAIDRMDAELPELKSFILPGGHISASMAHVARTVCRRAERHVMRLVVESEEKNVSEAMLKSIVYLNRLSDYLFMLARYCNHIFGVKDILWTK